MDTAQLESIAISANLSAKWDEAIFANQTILEADPINVNALNRLAFAYANKGDVQKAKKASLQVLKIDPINPIAQKAIKKWSNLNPNSKFQSKPTLTSSLFLEEPGKTRITNLICLGDRKTIDTLTPGEVVSISSHSHKVSVVNTSGKYIGRLPDDLSLKIRKDQQSGIAYEALIKSANPNEVCVFLRNA